MNLLENRSKTMRMLLIEIPTSSPRKRYKNNPAIAGNILYNQIRLAFLPQNKDFILHLLYPDKYKSKSDIPFSVGRTTRINKLLKAEDLLDGQEIRYHTMTKEQVEQLDKDTKGQELFAVFSKKDTG